MKFEEYRECLISLSRSVCVGVLADAEEDPDISLPEFVDLYRLFCRIG